MTVNELNTLTRKLIQQGHGTKKIFQSYDCNYAYTGIGGKVKIEDDAIILLETMYLDEEL